MQKQRATKTIVWDACSSDARGGRRGAGFEAIFRVQFLNTSLLPSRRISKRCFTSEDRPGGLPARVALRLFDAAGRRSAVRTPSCVPASQRPCATPVQASSGRSRKSSTRALWTSRPAGSSTEAWKSSTL